MNAKEGEALLLVGCNRFATRLERKEVRMGSVIRWRKVKKKECVAVDRKVMSVGKKSFGGGTRFISCHLGEQRIRGRPADGA